MLLTPEELLAGKDLTFEVTIPDAVLRPTPHSEPVSAGETDAKRVELRPLTVRDVQRIARAAKEDEVLTSVLMIHEALVRPRLERDDIAALHSGLVRFLVDAINRISGLTGEHDELRQFAEAPLVQAFFVLAREFKWTPEQVRALTVGQILGYLELLNRTPQQVGAR